MSPRHDEVKRQLTIGFRMLWRVSLLQMHRGLLYTTYRHQPALPDIEQGCLLDMWAPGWACGRHRQAPVEVYPSMDDRGRSLRRFGVFVHFTLPYVDLRVGAPLLHGTR